LTVAHLMTIDLTDFHILRETEADSPSRQPLRPIKASFTCQTKANQPNHSL